jgi:hypothetical protein
MAYSYYKLERDESGFDIHDSFTYDVGYFRSDVPDEKAFGRLYSAYLTENHGKERSNEGFVKYLESKGYKAKHISVKTARIFW